MKKLVKLMALMAMLPSIGMGQLSISGKMINSKTGETLSNGKISINGNYEVVATDTKGIIRLNS